MACVAGGVIRTQVCWDATARIVAGLVVIALGQVAGAALLGVSFVGWLLALLVVVPTLLYGVFLGTKGLWLVVEEAAREAVEGRPRSDLLSEK